VEDTRNGGLQFATELVTASLSGLLQEKDEQERASGVGGRSSRYVTEDSEGGRKRRELEIDELEIQKGLEQISKALEFLHDNAGLVHGNLTPDAVFVNAKVSVQVILRLSCLDAPYTRFSSLVQSRIGRLVA
jgi:SCY1-like protein 2